MNKNQKAIDQMIGGIKKRRAEVKLQVEKRRAAEAEAQAKQEKDDKARAKKYPGEIRKPDQIDAPDVAEAKKIESDTLVVEDDGTPPPAGPIGPGTIHFSECPDKLEPNPLNLVARESLERQISDLMEKVNQALTYKKHLIKDALSVLEFARTTAYTHPMGEVSVNLFEGASRLSEVEPELSNTVNRLANLAMEVRQSEQVRQNQGG